MTTRRRVAILFPADAEHGLATPLAQTRHEATAEALRSAGLDVVGAPYADALVDDMGAHLAGVDGVLVWYNPYEGGRDRSMLNAMLIDIASRGVFVSTHPDIIDQIGTKEVLYRTRKMGWGCDTRFYTTADAMLAQLPASLALGAPRVLKQIRGQSGDGIWQVTLAYENSAVPNELPPNTLVRIQHAKRGSPEELMPLTAFVDRCRAYFTAAGGMIDQAYQPRLTEGMVRCYLVGDRVAGFGEQLVNMLFPAPTGAPSDNAPLPGPRLYFPPTRPDFQRLKQMLEDQWVGEMCQTVGIDKSQLPVLWDADFLYGAKNAEGAGTYVLCEINVSSVYPFPPSALAPLVAETVARLEQRG